MKKSIELFDLAITEKKLPSRLEHIGIITSETIKYPFSILFSIMSIAGRILLSVAQYLKGEGKLASYSAIKAICLNPLELASQIIVDTMRIALSILGIASPYLCAQGWKFSEYIYIANTLLQIKVQESLGLGVKEKILIRIDPSTAKWYFSSIDNVHIDSYIRELDRKLNLSDELKTKIETEAPKLMTDYLHYLFQKKYEFFSKSEPEHPITKDIWSKLSLKTYSRLSEEQQRIVIFDAFKNISVRDIYRVKVDFDLNIYERHKDELYFKFNFKNEDSQFLENERNLQYYFNEYLLFGSIYTYGSLN